VRIGSLVVYQAALSSQKACRDKLGLLYRSPAGRTNSCENEMTLQKQTMNKVPQITLAFWAIKICATTLGETGGDAVSMTLGLGYLASTAIFFAIFLVLVTAQIRTRHYHPALYWAVILATTTAGTTLSDFLDRTAQLGYLGGSLLLVTLLLLVLAIWRWTLGKVVFEHVTDPKAEAFYWVTILVSNTLGTALGDFTSDGTSLGFVGAALLFIGLLALVSAAYFLTKISRVFLFWTAFVLTRPLGAALGDTLTKSHDEGGLALGTVASSIALAIAVVVLIVLTSRKASTAHDG
jgi:uncharacterized membrane-anchored protein